MTNLEVAQCFLGNALAYAKHDSTTSHADALFKLQTVTHNLEYIVKLLKKPNEENQEHDWGDFQ